MRLTSLLNPGYVYQRRDRIWPHVKAKSHKKLKDVQRFMAVNGLPIAANDRKLAALKDKHKGQRCFVIGNGPSLRISDLDRLMDEVTFACNKVYLAFEQTDWRPTYYVAEDRLMFQHHYDTINNLHGCTKLFPIWVKQNFPPLQNAIYYRNVYENSYPQLPSFGLNPLDRLYGGNTVTYLNLQIACFMGIREIYLLGVDFNYIIPNKSIQDRYNTYSSYKLYISEGEANHFHPDYIKPGEELYDPNLCRHEKAYLAAREAVQQLGGQIFNATRGGKLEFFPRVDFDTLF